MTKIDRDTQYARIGALITRRTGATALELMQATASTCVHKRLSEMRQRQGWSIYRIPVEGETFGSYHGIGPFEFS